jgi:ribulose-5-phosphate 4-epimerase/fuculose-1-phosphate aldolase
VDEAGIGFGNISVREVASSHFYVTGSNTGDKSELTEDDCAKVIQYCFSKNWLLFEGKAMPSSESLTHASIYQARPAVGAIIHGHHAQLWASLLRHAPATRVEAEYGTPEMAKAVTDLLETVFASDEGGNAFAMGGHEGGVMIFGHNLRAAYDALLMALKKSS